MLEKRFAFDLELLVVARRMGYRNFVELPVQIAERFTSTISPKAVWRTLLDTLAIFYRLRFAHFYGPQLAPSPWPQQGRPARPPVPGHQVDAPSLAAEHWHGPGPMDRPLRILAYNWRDLAHPRAGGAEVYLQSVAREWVKCGHEVTIFCAAVDGRPARELADGVGDHTTRRASRRLPGGQALLAVRGRRPVRPRGRLREYEAVPLSSLCGERAGRGRRPPGRQGDLAVRDSLADLRSWPLPAGAGLAAGIPGCTGCHGVRVKPRIASGLWPATGHSRAGRMGAGVTE